MKTMGTDFKKVVDRVKVVQNQLQALLKDKTWVEEARKYAERQSREAKKLFAGDVDKVKTFLEREKQELNRFQKQIPGEVEKFRKFVGGQREELENLLVSIREASSEGKTRTARTAHARKKTTSSRKKTASNGKTKAKTAERFS